MKKINYIGLTTILCLATGYTVYSLIKPKKAAYLEIKKENKEEEFSDKWNKNYITLTKTNKDKWDKNYITLAKTNKK